MLSSEIVITENLEVNQLEVGHPMWLVKAHNWLFVAVPKLELEGKN